MKKEQHFTFSYTCYPTEQDLPDEELALLHQENAASPSSLCAERVAVYHASALHPGKRIVRIAVCGGRRGETNLQPVSPCGACRQAILEYAQRQNSPIDLLFAGSGPAPAVKVRIADLLPFGFGSEDLLG